MSNVKQIIQVGLLLHIMVVILLSGAYTDQFWCRYHHS